MGYFCFKTKQTLIYVCVKLFMHATQKLLLMRWSKCRTVKGHRIECYPYNSVNSARNAAATELETH